MQIPQRATSNEEPVMLVFTSDIQVYNWKTRDFRKMQISTLNVKIHPRSAPNSVWLTWWFYSNLASGNGQVWSSVTEKWFNHIVALDWRKQDSSGLWNVVNAYALFILLLSQWRMTNEWMFPFLFSRTHPLAVFSRRTKGWSDGSLAPCTLRRWLWRGTCQRRCWAEPLGTCRRSGQNHRSKSSASTSPVRWARRSVATSTS